MSGDRWTREEVEDRLAKWNRDLAVASQNILELMEDLDYKALGTAALSGVTAARVTPVLASLEELWQVLPLLARVIEDANARFGKLPWFNHAEPLWQIQQLLEGESVKLTTKTTYAQRGLLTPDEITRALSPERVLAAMIEAYAQSKEIVVEVGKATSTLGPELAAAARALDDLERELPDHAEVAALRARLAGARAELASDPLGTAAELVSRLGPAIARLRDDVATTRAERAAVDHELASASTRLTHLASTHADAVAAHAECAAKVVTPLAAPPPPDVVDELTRWLERLRQTRAAGRWQAARIGLANWRARLDARVAELGELVAASRRQLARRNELRGLLDGLKAKAAATGLAEDAVAVELYRRAHALLYARPTPLAEAEKLVHEYLAAVR